MAYRYRRGFRGLGDLDCSTVQALQAAGVPAPSDAASLTVWNQCRATNGPPAFGPTAGSDPACVTINQLKAAGVPPPSLKTIFVNGLPMVDPASIQQVNLWAQCGDVTRTPAAPPPAPPAPPAAPPPAPPAPAPLAPAASVPVFSGLSFSSVPWWGWAAGAAVAFFALKGGKH